MSSPPLPPAGQPASIDLEPFARRLEVAAYDLATTGRLSRWAYSQVIWTGEARRELDAELDRLDAQLAAIVTEIHERAEGLRREMRERHDR